MGGPTMSIASKPNALAATTIFERVYSSSCRLGDRIMPVSAQSKIVYRRKPTTQLAIK